MRLSVVVPAYREADRISATVTSLRQALAAVAGSGGCEIVVVDDGSDDGTAGQALRAGADVVLGLPVNSGKGAAVRAGVGASSGDVVVFTDADLTYPGHQIVRLLEAIEAGADMVIGNRHHPETVRVSGPSLLRSAGSRMIRVLVRLARLGGHNDTQCGLKAFRADVARRLFETSGIDGFAFDIELLYLARRHGLAVRELPVEVVDNDSSTVRLWRDGLAVSRDIARIRWRAARGRYDILAGDAQAGGTLAGDAQAGGTLAEDVLAEDVLAGDVQAGDASTLDAGDAGGGDAGAGEQALH